MIFRYRGWGRQTARSPENLDSLQPVKPGSSPAQKKKSSTSPETPRALQPRAPRAGFLSPRAQARPANCIAYEYTGIISFNIHYSRFIAMILE